MEEFRVKTPWAALYPTGIPLELVQKRQQQVNNRLI